MDIFQSGKTVGGILSLAFCILAVNAHAKLNDVEALQQQALKDNIERFGKFTQNKDVMGRARLPNGQNNQGGEKDRMNQDDGVSYTSIFTYHRNAFDSREEVPDPQGGTGPDGKPKTKEQTLNLYVSDHGKLAGDSSILERLIYKFHQMFSSQEKSKEEREALEKQGKREESVFIVEKQEVEDDQAQGKGKGEDSNLKKAERYFLKEEVAEATKKEVGQVGFNNVEKASKDEQNQDDPQAMGYLPFFYEAAQRAYEGWRDTTLAGLGQRRIYNVATVRASESAPSCDAATQQTLQMKIQRANGDQDAIKRAQEEAQKDLENCKKVAALDYREIAPVKETDENGKSELKSEGLAKEDGIQRDLRVQAEVLDRFGITAKDVKSGWKYKEEDFKSKVGIKFNERGEAIEEVDMTGAEQLDSFNQQLTEADQKWGDVKGRLQGSPYDTGDVNASQFEERPGEKYAGDISKIRAQNREEDFGSKPPESEQNQLATTYDDILKKQAESTN
jgi:hypothetical protein